MTPRNRRVAPSAAFVALAHLVGCFQDAPAIGDVGPTEGDGDSSESGDEPSTSNDPTTPTQTGSAADDDSSDDDSSDDTTAEGPSCDEPPCPEPGQTLWTTRIGAGGRDGTYAVLVQDDAVFAFGERAQGGGTDPWSARLAVEDGAIAWEQTSPSNEGGTMLRGATLVGSTLVAVGATQTGALYNGFFETRSTSGDALFEMSFGESGSAFLLDVIASPDGAIAVGWFDPGSGAEPWLLQLVGDEGQWNLEQDSADAGTFGGMQGTLFAIVARGDGSLVAVGYQTNPGSNDAMAMMLSPSGEPLGEPVLVGGNADDDFTQVALIDDDTAIAVGRQSTSANASQVAIATLDLGGSLSVTDMRIWGDDAYTVANGMVADGETVFIAAGASNDPDLGPDAFESRVMRFDPGEDTPTWVVPFETDSPGRDYAADVAIVDGDTIVVCGVVASEDDAEGDLWIRRMLR